MKEETKKRQKNEQTNKSDFTFFAHSWRSLACAWVKAAEQEGGGEEREKKSIAQPTWRNDSARAMQQQQRLQKKWGEGGNSLSRLASRKFVLFWQTVDCLLELN